MRRLKYEKLVKFRTRIWNSVYVFAADPAGEKDYW